MTGEPERAPLFDTNVLIAHLRGEERATALLLAAPGGRAAVSVLARTEIEGGMRSGERRDVAVLFSGVDLLPVTDAIARQAGVWLRAHGRSHPGVDLVDYLVAASAWYHDLRLVTLNVKHFPMFPGLAPAW